MLNKDVGYGLYFGFPNDIKPGKIKKSTTVFFALPDDFMEDVHLNGLDFSVE